MACTPANTVTAEVVALEHVITYNRFGAFNPAGMIYALRRDLEPGSQWSTDDQAKLRAGRVQLRTNKRPRPLVLRVNEGDCLEVTFWNMLSPVPPTHGELRRVDFPPGMVAEHALQESTSERLVPLQRSEDSDFPYSRAASMHVNGLDYVDIHADGANVGLNPSSLVEPGDKTVYRWFARAEGAYFLYSNGALAGGEGDGGQLGLGLFGVVAVEPRNSVWYRSQVTATELRDAAARDEAGRFDYTRLDYSRLAILSARRETLHSDLNAVVYVPEEGQRKTLEDCRALPPGSGCGSSFREFTTVFHDENKVFQAFYELEDEQNPISRVADGMAINYGASGAGAVVLASRKGLGPAKDCVECKFEEFFLSSWANGDPAMVVRRDTSGRAVEALYPDDPSNVHHSYLGDPVRFRNLHAGPKETHVFHLHAHQWLRDGKDPNASYLDSQTISPGSSFSYDIHYGGSGNRNLTVGDSIFHCHLYPHFAAGMWELWRVHDVFEDGAPGLFGPANADGRALPDGEIAGGTPNPAVVPIPGHALAPSPTAEFRGYPFYIPGEAGHRPPQPPLDMALDQGASGSEGEREVSGGLPRHVVVGGHAAREIPSDELLDGLGDKEENAASRYVARRTFALNGDPALLSLARRIEVGELKFLPRCGTPEERIAMNFHAGGGAVLPSAAGATCWDPATSSQARAESHPVGWKTRGLRAPLWQPAVIGDARVARTPGGEKGGQLGSQFVVNGRPPAPGAPFANPCPADAPSRIYKSAYIQFDLTVNKYGWHDPQARMPVLEGDIAATLNRTRLPEPLFFRANSNDCIHFEATNLIPSALNLDDFQIYSPTDTIGQHIHLVKFDVTASDGSGNGWNYEDGTFAADEVRERLHAYQKFLGANDRGAEVSKFRPKTHPMFKAHGTMAGDRRGLCSDVTGNLDDDDPVKGNPWCGAQTTVQRWWADPLLNDKGEDRTLRAVFTHDHFGPSSHQQHGFYAALIVEPNNSVWTDLATPVDGVSPAADTASCPAGVLGGSVDGTAVTCRADGGPTSYRANIGFTNGTWAGMSPAEQKTARYDVRREFNLAFADFAILYDAALQPVNPPGRDTEGALPSLSVASAKPQPEGISAEDPGTRLLNYRNEPVPLRIGERSENSLQYRQAMGTDGQPSIKGDVAHVFWSAAHREDDTKEISDAQATDEAARLATAVVADTGYPSTVETRTQLSALLERQQLRTNTFRRQIRATEPWRVDGDPSTPVLAAYEGEPLKLNLIQGAQEEQHVFVMNGTKWLSQARSKNSGYMNGQQLGISEHFEFDVNVSTNRAEHTDYWFGSPAVENVWDGMWGILRSQGWRSVNNQTVPAALPSVARLPPSAVSLPPLFVGEAAQFACPSTARTRYFVSAWLARDIVPGMAGAVGGVTYNSRFGITDPNAVVFVELPGTQAAGDLGQPDIWRPGQEIRDFLRERYRTAPLEPLVLRAAAGDCIEVVFKNYLPRTIDDGPVRPLLEQRNALVEELQGGRRIDEVKASLGEIDRRLAELRRSWSYNLMPPIVPGLNFNDVRMSTRIGLSPQLVYENAATSPGQEAIGDNRPANLGRGSSGPALEPGCQGVDGTFNRCSDAATTYTWYAGDVKHIAKVEPGQCDGIACTDRPAGTGALRYTPIEFGATSIRSVGDVIKHSSHGGVGALIVLPPRTCYVPDPSGRTTVADIYHDLRPESEVRLGRACESGAPAPSGFAFRDAVLVFQDDLSLKQDGQPMPNHRMADDAEDTGQKGFNYRSDPLWARNGVGTSGADFNELNQVRYENTLSSKPSHSPAGCPAGEGCGDPGVVFEAKAGMPVRFRLVHPAGHSRQHAFTLHGHNFARRPFTANSTTLTAAGNEYKDWTGLVDGLGPGRHVDVLVQAGGQFCVAGDYLFRAQENFQFQGGLWGIFRVLPPETRPATCVGSK